MNRRLLAIILTVAMYLTFLPANVWAVDMETNYVHEDVVNENISSNFREESIVAFCIDNPDTLLSDAAEYGSKSDAIAALRQTMVQRESTITLYYVSENSNGQEEALDVLDQAMAHTGNPVEGDYLRWHRSTIRYSYYPSPYYDNGVYHHMARFELTYYTTAQQEAELTAAVNTLLTSLNLDGMSDYEKFSAIYDYICANITYDYTNLNDDNYKLKYTAYAALINKTSVCQGYANLLYRLMLEVGIDCRLISGIGNGGGHGWNIVRMGDYYYNVDSTWDAGSLPQYYDYCLVTDGNFGDHTRDAEYATAAFYAEYPMGTTNYQPSGHTMTAYPAKEATCTTDGNIAYWYCSHCNKYFADANGENEIEEGSWFTEAHGVRIVSYNAPTETEPGNIAHYYCPKCDKYYIEGQGGFVEVSAEDVILPATGPQVIWGDADGNGQVTKEDASAIKAYRAGLSDGSQLDMDAADLDGNGKVDVYDAYLIQLYIAGQITEFPAEG